VRSAAGLIQFPCGTAAIARFFPAQVSLACSADPRWRSHGFQRHLGWKATGGSDEAGNQILGLA